LFCSTADEYKQMVEKREHARKEFQEKMTEISQVLCVWLNCTKNLINPNVYHFKIFLYLMVPNKFSFR